MAINIMEQNGNVPYDIVTLVCDKAADVANLPTAYAPGSTAICVADSKVFMLNGDKEWKEI